MNQKGKRVELKFQSQTPFQEPEAGFEPTTRVDCTRMLPDYTTRASSNTTKIENIYKSIKGKALIKKLLKNNIKIKKKQMNEYESEEIK